MQLNKKGSFSVITAIGAVALLLFIINGSINVSQTNNSFLKMQAGRETVLDVENAIRIYDKAANSEILANVNSNPTCISTLSSGTLQAAFNSIGFCEIQNVTITPGSSPTVTGKIVCREKIQGFEINEERNITFTKNLDGTAGACTISG